MKLWLVRHARPTVEPGVCYGRSDVPADRGATAALAEQLVARLPPTLRVRTSPLARCRQLADALAALHPPLQATEDERLQEMDFGRWELQPWDRIGQAALRAWTQEFASYRPGGGESVQALLDRVRCALQETRAAGQDTLWITHAGVMRAVRLLVSGGRSIHDAAQWPAEPIPFAAVHVHELGGPGPLSAAAGAAPG